MPRELQNLEIEEISLVDEPAVPKAKFLIMKRNQENSEVQKMDENIDKQTIPDELKKLISTVLDQIKSALKGLDLPQKAKDLIDAALSSLEAIASGYGYPQATYGYPAPQTYPAPQKSVETEKTGKKFSKDNEDRIKEIYRLAKELLDQIGSIEDATNADKEGPWEVKQESEILSKCIEVVNDITKRLGGK